MATLAFNELTVWKFFLYMDWKRDQGKYSLDPPKNISDGELCNVEKLSILDICGESLQRLWM